MTTLQESSFDRVGGGTGDVADLAAPVHQFTRNGRELRTKVYELDSDAGHALVFGTIHENCLVRIHSRCLYGDALGSDDCDCGPELERSMDMIQVEGCGVLIYLEQEGRGAGLIAKARGYALSQTEGLDTFDSYERLGYDPDGRSYNAAVALLKYLEVNSVRLMTNNPDKLSSLVSAGLKVSQVPLLIAPRNERARRYLATKRERRRHSLPRNWRVRRVCDGVLNAGVVAWYCAMCAAVGVLLMLAAGVSGAGIGIVVDRAVSFVAGIAAAGWFGAKTRLMRARIALLCQRSSEAYRAASDAFRRSGGSDRRR